MAVQNAYRENIAPGVPGARADQTPVTFLSREVEVSAGVPFGAAVVQGGNERGIVLATGSGDVVIGVAVLERTPRISATLPDGFSLRDSARVGTQGAFWVIAETAVAEGDPVHARAGGGWGNAGGTLVAGARFETRAAVGELAILRLGGAAHAAAAARDVTPPTYVSGTTTSATVLTLTFSEALTGTKPAATAFTVKEDGVVKAGALTVGGTGTSLTLTGGAGSFVAGKVYTVSYDEPTANPLRDAAGRRVESFADKPVTNTLT